MLLDISNSIISIPADSTHLSPLVSELLTLNNVNATKKADETRTNKAAYSENQENCQGSTDVTTLLYFLVTDFQSLHTKKKGILPMMFLLNKW